MKTPLYYVILFTFLFVSCIVDQLSAQIVLPKPIISRWSEGSLLVRWEPASLEEWNAAMKTGYTIEIVEPNGTTVYNHQIIPKSNKEFQKMIVNVNADIAPFYEASADLMYTDQHNSNSEMGKLIEEVVETSSQTTDSFRLSFLSFYSSYDMSLAESIGLGIQIPGMKTGSYKGMLYVDGFPKRNFTIEPEKKHNQQPEALAAKWGDHKVRLEWNTYGKYKEYIGYHIERSADGKKFFRMSTIPFLDPAVGEQGDKQSALIGIEDSLEVNYKTYSYQLRAMDYFGVLTPASPVVSGHGFDIIQTTPQIVKAEQTDHNQAHLVWTTNEKDYSLINHFNVLQSDTMDGKYTIAKESVSKETTEVYITMQHESNFFRVEIIPNDGEPVSSFPVFVMGMDTIPPAVPKVIGASIDTLGRVKITWNANTESDLWGYKIFMANFGTDEYSLLNATPLMDTFYVDSVSLKLGTKNIYYVLQAADQRNNRSAFTEPIIIAKPDILPPGIPMILHLTQQSDTVAIQWARSGSDDAILHQLFRRNLDGDEGWSLIKQFDTLHIDSIYFDAGLQVGSRYAYTMRAVDDAGLLSEMAKMQVIFLKKQVPQFVPFENIETVFDEAKKEMKLTWTCNDSEELTSVLIYRGWEKDKLSKYKYIDSPEMSLTDDLKGRKTVYYMLKPTFKNHNDSYYSNVIEYVVEK